MVDDDMGNARNITLTTVANAAMASQMDGNDTLANTKEALDKISAEELDKKIEQLKSKKD